jgi:hypothetical protein
MDVEKKIILRSEIKVQKILMALLKNFLGTAEFYLFGAFILFKNIYIFQTDFLGLLISFVIEFLIVWILYTSFYTVYIMLFPNKALEDYVIIEDVELVEIETEIEKEDIE